ncbi:hypothetical protein SAMN05192559_104117 [Halobacillus karajensis]|uniref:hypothetical protein n=1 Tax=Halobacillus karajensis TaxID=195088 RepID=UPI0008A760A0|nr:hypothetical protein [Halobacillus karajensis]SEH78758.1 hypothetical protein SAMN05192559_104117 [Halobacillus karajensis]
MHWVLMLLSFLIVAVCGVLSITFLIIKKNNVIPTSGVILGLVLFIIGFGMSPSESAKGETIKGDYAREDFVEISPDSKVSISGEVTEEIEDNFIFIVENGDTDYTITNTSEVEVNTGDEVSAYGVLAGVDETDSTISIDAVHIDVKN